MIERINAFDFPKTKHIPDPDGGYYMREVPEPSTKNLLFLMKKINEIIDVVNEME